MRPDGTQGVAASSQYTVYGPSSAAWLPNGRGLLFHSRSSNFSATDGNGANDSLFVKVL